MGGAQHDGGLEIAAHAHGQAGQPVVFGHFRQQREERRGLDAECRHSHQADHRNSGNPRLLQQRRDFGDGAASLLLFRADIDLNKARQLPTSLVHRPGERLDERGTVERMDAVE